VIIESNKERAKAMATKTKKTTETKKTGGDNVAKKKTTNVRTAKKAHRESFSTHDGHALTASEAKFIDEYIKNGIARQAYIAAYPNSNPKCASQNADRLLNKPYINSEINYRLECAKNDSIASAEEIMNYLSDVMRGNIKDAFGLDAPLSERTRAAVELAKRQIDIPNKFSNNEQPELKITLDFGGGDEHPTVAEVIGNGNVTIEDGDTDD
jgi:phage terminase small subunit